MTPTRKPAFNPDDLNELDDILSAPLSAPPLKLKPQQEPEETTAEPARSFAVVSSISESRSLAVTVASQPDGGSAGQRTVAVRIPRQLYTAVNEELLNTLERPSYAQLVTWTIEDRSQDARSELERQISTDSRAPRGRRIAADAVPLAPRFRTEELAVLDALVDAVPGSSRTAAVIATLRVALRIAA